MPDFDLNIWNTTAEAQLFAEYQAIAARDSAEKTRGVFRCGLTTPTSSGSISQSSVSGGSTTFGPRLLKSTSFAVAHTILCELRAVFSASDRVGAVRVMIGKVVASAAITLSAECAVEIEQALLGQCEHIAASCATSDGERQAAENIKTHANGIATISTTLAANAFASLWQYITTGLMPTLPTLQTEAISSYDCTSFDGLVRACASIVARTVVSLRTGGDIAPPDQSTVPIDAMIETISIALYSVARWIMHQKDERGGWVPWVGSVLRGLIVADELQRHWTAPAFHIVEGQITPSLICPITVALVVDPVVSPHGRIYERERLYMHLQISGCDPVSKEHASALNYARSPVAARLAKEVARHYGARLEPL